MKELEDNLEATFDKIIKDFYNSVIAVNDIGGTPGPGPVSSPSPDLDPSSKREPTGPLFRYHGTGRGRLPGSVNLDRQAPGDSSQGSTPTPTPTPATSNQPKKNSLKDLWGFSKWMMKGGPWRNKNESIMNCIARIDEISHAMLDFMVENTVTQQDREISVAFQKLRDNLRKATIGYMRNAYNLGMNHKEEADDEIGAEEIEQGGGTEDQTLDWFKDNDENSPKYHTRIKFGKVNRIVSYLAKQGVQATDPEAVLSVLEPLGYRGTGEDAVNDIAKKHKSKKSSDAIGVQSVSSKEKTPEPTPEPEPEPEESPLSKFINKPAKPKKRKSANKLPPLSQQSVDPNDHQNDIAGLIDDEYDD
ncbi:MAG: hypothetical protein ACW99G_00510 [Candidatus Thorarchaeota archaeon]